MNRRQPSARDRFAARPTRRELNARRDRKERNRRKIDWIAVARTVLVTVLIGQLLRVAFASPRMRLREVRVSGTTRLTPADVQKLAAVPLGENIFRVNLVRVSTRLRANPIIREATVTRDLPAALDVHIQERVPAFQVITAARTYLADAGGTVYESVPVATDKLPVLEVQPKDLRPLGKKLRLELTEAVRQCARLAQKERLKVGKMRVDAGGELWLNVETSPISPTGPSTLVVRVGRFTELPEKFRDIRQALQGWPNLTASAAYLNVMCAGSPAYMTAAERPAEQTQN